MTTDPHDGGWSVEIRGHTGAPAGPLPGGGHVVAYAQRSRGGWRIVHRDGRAVRAATGVEALERMLLISYRDGPVDTVLLVAREGS